MSYLSAKINTEIKIDRLEITGFRSVSLSNLLIKDLRQDTLIHTGRFKATLAKRAVEMDFSQLERITLDDATFRLNKPFGREKSNLKILLDFFTKVDSLKEQQDQISKIPDKSLELARERFRISSLKVRNSRFSFIDENINTNRDGVDFKDTEINNLWVDARNLVLVADTFTVQVDQISVVEKSGFRVDSLSCDFKISPTILQAKNLKTRTRLNDLDLDFSFHFDTFKDFKDFIHKIRIETSIRPSLINLTEVGYFAPVMYTMDNRLRISASIKGTVSNFKAKDLKVGIGKTTQFKGNVQMNGLPDVRETFSHLTIESFITTIEDAKSFRLPTEKTNISLPDILEKFGIVQIKGKFTGFYNDFVSYASFKTSIGDFDTDILVRVNAENNIEYDGHLAAHDFNAGSFFNFDDHLGTLNLTANIEGSGISFENMNIQMNGVVDSLDFFDNKYNEIEIQGELKNKKYSGLFSIIDDNVFLDFNGSIDYGKNIPEYNFSAIINDAYLHRINLIDRDESSKISTTLQINFMGDRLDNTQGIIIIDSTVYSEKNKSYLMEDLTLSITRGSSEYAIIRLYSDIIDASAEGMFSFVQLQDNLQLLLNNYLDTLITDPILETDPAMFQDFIFSVNLKNTEPVSELFFPFIYIPYGATISGGYNSSISNLFLDGKSELILYNGAEIYNWYLDYFLMDESMQLITGAEQLYYSDTLRSDDVKIHLKARNDSIFYLTEWKDQSKNPFSSGTFSGIANIQSKNKYNFSLDSLDIDFSGTKWTVSPGNFIQIDSSKLQLGNLTLRSSDQAIGFDGSISWDPLDSLSCILNNFNLSNFDLLLNAVDIDLDGYANGDIKFLNLYESPFYLSNIEISDFYFNKEKLGTASLNTIWDSRQNAFDLNGKIIYTGNSGQDTTLSIEGKYFPKDTLQNFIIDLHLNKYKVNTLEPFTKSFSSDLNGMASGSLFLRGTNEQPVLTGEINLMRIAMLIDYLNVKYYFADKIYFDENRFYFENMVINDSIPNQAIASGSIYHDHLSDFNFDLRFTTPKLLGLNTKRTQNDVFYGNAFASGEIAVTGPVNDLNLAINVRSEKGTMIKIPVSYGTDIGTNDYIVFVSEEEDEKILRPEPKIQEQVDLGGLSMNMDLKVTNDADIQLFMPYNMGNIRGRGKGDMKMTVDPEENFTIDGQYVIDRGSFFFTLQNIINRNFDIRRGSRIIWNGDPYNAKINMTAVYKVKTYLGDYGPPSQDSTRVPVDCIISLRNNLLNPDIHFNVEFPDLTDDTRQFVYSRLDTTDQAEMSRQMISLLVMNNFYRSEGFSGSVGFNTFDLVTNQLNNWLSQISNDFDIGVNYRPGNEISSQEVEVALSTQLFEDRVLIDGNVGMRGNETTSQKTNNIVGEVTVEVKITPDGRFRAKAFNKSNNNYLYKNYAPYTQGVGVFYTQEFDRINEIFRGKRKKEKTQKVEYSTGEDTVRK